MSESHRLIKKYPNRRLYDTWMSTYITLADVKSLVMALETVKVVDARSGNDLTHSVLLQIIAEEECAGVPLFTPELLAQMIRFYGHSMQGMLGKYLEASLASFADFQDQLHEQSHVLHGENSGQMQSEMWSQFMTFQVPAMRTMMATYMEQTRKMAHQMRDQLKNQTQNLFPAATTPAKPVSPSDTTDSPDSFDH